VKAIDGIEGLHTNVKMPNMPPKENKYVPKASCCIDHCMVKFASIL
jgi:hypothetical protein